MRKLTGKKISRRKLPRQNRYAAMVGRIRVNRAKPTYPPR